MTDRQTMTPCFTELAEHTTNHVPADQRTGFFNIGKAEIRHEAIHCMAVITYRFYCHGPC